MCLHEVKNPARPTSPSTRISTTSPTVTPSNQHLLDTEVEFPSFGLFYRADQQTMLNVVNSLLIMDHFINGTKKDYQELTEHQNKDNILSWLNFSFFSKFFTDFRYKPYLAKSLKLFIYIDGISRTDKAKKLINNLSSEYRYTESRSSLAVSIITHELLLETKDLSMTEFVNLRQAFIYRQHAKSEIAPHTMEFNDDIMRIAQAGIICDVAGLLSDPLALGSSIMLTETMAQYLRHYVENRHRPEIAREFCALSGD